MGAKCFLCEAIVLPANSAILAFSKLPKMGVSSCQLRVKCGLLGVVFYPVFRPF